MRTREKIAKKIGRGCLLLPRTLSHLDWNQALHKTDDLWAGSDMCSGMLQSGSKPLIGLGAPYGLSASELYAYSKNVNRPRV